MSSTSKSPEEQPRSNSASFPFLDLPAELRNRIYRLSLLQEDGKAIRVHQKGHHRPALLNTNHQIRSEALKIFYYEQNFCIFFPNYDSTTARKFQHHLIINLDLDPTQSTARFLDLRREKPNWGNLLRWLRDVHGRSVSQILMSPSKMNSAEHDMGAEDLVLGGLFSIARTLRGAKWEIVVELLEEQRVILAKLDARWGGE